MDDLARLLRALRRRDARQRGQPAWTYRELAAKTGWSRGILGEYFAGHIMPPTDRFDTLMQLLGATATEQGALATARDRVEEYRRDVPAPTLASACPYRGLSVFREPDAALFCGREELTEALVADLHRKPLVALVGPSGSGKSSLVFAGAASRLRAGGWAIADLRPAVGASPLSALAAALLPLLGESMTTAGDLEAELAGDGLAGVVERILLHQGTDQLLLIVDQFEELYAQPPAAARRFVDVLLQSATGLTVVLTLRTDFLGHALDHVELAQSMQGSTLMIGRMTRAQLGRAIEGPLPEPACYEPGLVERILSDVGAAAGNLALLEFTLTRLWPALTHAAYDRLGGVAAALGRYAEDVYHRELRSSEPQVHRLFVQLVSPGGTTRRVARRGELGESLWPLAQRLAGTRLVVIGHDEAGGDIVELAHEALISAWDRLHAWADTDRDFRGWQERLRAALAQWEASGRDHGALLRGAPLAEAQRWDHERGADLSAAERAFIHAGQAVQGRAVRRLRAFVAGLVVLLLVASGLAFSADQQRRQVRDNERLATSGLLAAQADATLRTRPVTSILLAVQAYNEGGTVDARGSLLRHLAEHSHTNGFLIGHTSRVSAVAYSPDSTIVATASVDATARLWDARTHRLLATLTGHTNWLRTVAFSPGGRLLATAGDDQTIRLWDVRTHAALATLTGHTGPVRAVTFSPDGRLLATTGDDHTVRLWDVASRRELATLTGHTGPGRAVSFSPDGHLLATGSFDHTVRLWDVATRRQLATLIGHRGWVLGVVFSSDGRTLASTSADHAARLWDVTGHRELATLTGHTDLVLSASFSPDGHTLATSGADDTARLWDVSTRQQTTVLTGHSGWVTGVAFSPDGAVLATSSDDLTARLWNVRPRRGPIVLPGSPGATAGLAYSPDGTLVATAGFDHRVRLIDVAGRRVVATLTGHTDSVAAVAFSPDGRTLATASDDHTVRLWDVAGHRQLAVLTGHTGSVRGVAFSPDGRMLATTSREHTVRLWDVTTHAALAVLTGHTDQANGLAVSPDSRILATADDDRTVRLWDVGGHRELAVLTGHTDKVSAVAFSPNGRILATGGQDTTVRLWDVAGRREIAILTGHTGWVWSVAFSPDGHTVASAADDGTVRLWDVPTRRELAALPGHSETVPRLAFSPDGQLLAALGSDTTVRLWNMNAASSLRGLCALAGRNLTRPEWDEFLPGRRYETTCPGQP